jgi:hypothetical protein
VGTIQELLDATASAASGDTIALKDGTYRVTSYGIVVRTAGITFKSQSGEREKVVVSGAGMHGDIQYGFWVDAPRVTIRDLTVCDVIYHCIQTDVNIDSLRVINCVLRDAFEQLLKIPAGADVNDPSEGGLVEGCLFEFTKGIAEQYYTGGVDCHFGKNWTVRNNVFKNIRSPDGQVAEHAVHFWNKSEGTVVENNLIVSCDRGIGFGLGDSPHTGGVIRNNMIYHAAIEGADNGDVGIGLESCTNAQVYNNTIYFDNGYPNAIEYRFAATSGLTITNNLTNKAIKQRDGASASVTGNITDAQAGWFQSPSAGNLHLQPTAAAAIDRGAAVTGLSVDIDGQPRPSGAIDVGADEYYPSGVLRRNPLIVGKEAHDAGRLIWGEVFDISGRRVGSGFLFPTGAGFFFPRTYENQHFPQTAQSANFVRLRDRGNTVTPAMFQRK